MTSEGPPDAKALDVDHRAHFWDCTRLDLKVAFTTPGSKPARPDAVV